MSVTDDVGGDGKQHLGRVGLADEAIPVRLPLRRAPVYMARAAAETKHDMKPWTLQISSPNTLMVSPFTDVCCYCAGGLAQRHRNMQQRCGVRRLYSGRRNAPDGVDDLVGEAVAQRLERLAQL